jgi:hypothetical protein
MTPKKHKKQPFCREKTQKNKNYFIDNQAKEKFLEKSCENICIIQKYALSLHRN